MIVKRFQKTNTSRANKQITSGFSGFTNFDCYESKTRTFFYKDVDDMRKFCVILKENSQVIINFEHKKCYYIC